MSFVVNGGHGGWVEAEPNVAWGFAWWFAVGCEGCGKVGQVGVGVFVGWCVPDESWFVRWSVSVDVVAVLSATLAA